MENKGTLIYRGRIRFIVVLQRFYMNSRFVTLNYSYKYPRVAQIDVVQIKHREKQTMNSTYLKNRCIVVRKKNNNNKEKKMIYIDSI